MNRTALHDEHLALGARMVEFAGYDMPLHYGSQIEEHHAVRRSAGVFDVSHMGVLQVKGPDAFAMLSHLLSNSPARVERGRALYSLMLNENGGIIDDLMVYQFSDHEYWLVLNAANKHKDLKWMQVHARHFQVGLRLMNDLAILALQGPKAREIARRLVAPTDAETLKSLGRFQFARIDGVVWARTGYTGEDGFEIILPNGEAPVLWRRLLGAEVKPVGLGARDTLRLEAGMSLCGADMDESITPQECGLNWTLSFRGGRSFIGRQALQKQREAGIERKRIAVQLKGKGVLRSHQRIFSGECEAGYLTSGAFAPSLGHSIGFALVDAGAQGPFSAEIRGKRLPLETTDPPFVKTGLSKSS